MANRNHNQSMKKAPPPRYIDQDEIIISADKYAELIGKIEELKQTVADYRALEDARKRGIITESLRHSVKYKVTNFVLRVQANNSPEEVLERIDRATADICRFIAGAKDPESKKMISMIL